MKLALAGINHRTAPVEMRERVAFRLDELPQALHTLQEQPGLREGMILSTCNRVEITATLEDGADVKPVLCSFLSSTHQMTAEAIQPHLYVFEDAQAISHLFRVASSLDSMVVGEPQILGQLKQAYTQAKEAGTVGSYLETVLTRAFSVAKRVRTETEIGQSAVSVGYAAVELAREIFGSLQRRRVMIIGAGKMSEAAARHLQGAGARDILIANRTQTRADELAQLFDGIVVPYTSIFQHLPEVDIVITSSGAPHYVLTRGAVRSAIDARRNQPMFFIDIAVPRNIEPGVNDLEHAFLYDIDDLQRIVDRNLKGRQEVAGQAEKIVSQEVERLLARLRSRDIAPTIVSLQEQLEGIRREAFDRYRNRLGELTSAQQDAVEAMTRSIINKIAHGPISELRREISGHPGEEASEVISFVRRMFRLGDRESDK
ncbi:MAG TPA: glutamyl-tRNA reductase [Bryobacteraceae bacterium]|nr:glutamyl-tRNA reductase [Bryobacteraceae bacterium]